MRFDPILPQKFETNLSGCRLDTASAVTPAVERIERAAKIAGFSCKVTIKTDGSLDFNTYGLTLDTVIETQNDRMSVAEAIKLNAITGGGKIRCQATHRDSSSFAAFLSLGSDRKPFIFDSGTGTKDWLNDTDWFALNSQDKAAGQENNPIEFDYANFSNLKSNPPTAREWLVNGWFPVGSVVALFSPGGVGKTLFAQQLATHVVTRADLFGQKVMQGPVLGIMCEDENEELRRRQEDINAALHLDVLPAGLFIEGRAGKNNTLFTFTQQQPAPTELLRKIEAECATKKPVLVVIDNIAQVYAGFENDRHQVTVFCNALTGLAQKYRCCILLLGHTAKAEGSQYSGSTAWEAAVRTRLWLNRNEDGTMELRKAKANYSGLDSVTLQWQDGYLHTLSCGLNGSHAVSEKAMDAVVLALAEFTKAKVSTSNSSQARNYLPKLMLDDGKLFGINPQTAKKALSVLVEQGKIIPNSELGWKTSSRHPAMGLRRAAEKPTIEPESDA